jgi:hypothetical protein
MAHVYDSIESIKEKVASALGVLSQNGDEDQWLKARLYRIYSEATDCMMWLEDD